MDFFFGSLSLKKLFMHSCINYFGSSTSSQNARINSPMQLQAEFITKFSTF